MKKKVLMLLDNAPNYREEFLRQLGCGCDLTVFAQKCEPDYLTPPSYRSGYSYIEYTAFRVGPFRFQRGLAKLLRDPSWDLIFVNFNLKRPDRLLYFLIMPNIRPIWVWRGRIVGRIDKSSIGRALKKLFLKRAKRLLVYSDSDAVFCRNNYNKNTVSFNNTEVSCSEFRKPYFSKQSKLKLIYVGRFQKRKNLDRLLKLALIFPNIQIRIIGPSCEELKQDILWSDRLKNVEILKPLFGEEVNEHFDWCDAVVNPGHVGLLVMNAAKHGKPIFIDSSSEHAPEISLAQEADQYLLDFRKIETAGKYMLDLWSSYDLLVQGGHRLQRIAVDRYSVENMVKIHIKAVKELADEL